jgi:leucyl-tRNA synthetase
MQYLPIILPEVENTYEDGLPPLGNADVWAWDTATKVVNTNLVDNKIIFPLELNTMPGWAGFRLLDALYGCTK